MTTDSKRQDYAATQSALSAINADDSFLNGANAAFIDLLFRRYQEDPEAVSPRWRALFDAMPEESKLSDPGRSNAAAAPPKTNGASSNAQVSARVSAQASSDRPATSASSVQSTGNGRVLSLGDEIKGFEAMTADAGRKQAGVLRLISQYRTRGHQLADLDPLKLTSAPELSGLTPESNSLSDDDLDIEFNTGSLGAAERMPLRDVVDLLNDVYCGPVGSEYMFIMNNAEKRWIQSRLEQRPGRPNQAADARRKILESITAAEGLERYLHTKYVGQKRFSLEGSECLIPL